MLVGTLPKTLCCTLTEHNVEGGYIILVAAAVAVLRLLVKSTACKTQYGLVLVAYKYNYYRYSPFN